MGSCLLQVPVCCGWGRRVCNNYQGTLGLQLFSSKNSILDSRQGWWMLTCFCKDVWFSTKQHFLPKKVFLKSISLSQVLLQSPNVHGANCFSSVQIFCIFQSEIWKKCLKFSQYKADLSSCSRINLQWRAFWCIGLMHHFSGGIYFITRYWFCKDLVLAEVFFMG